MLAKRILFLSHRFHPDIGGIEVNSKILAFHFMALGYSVRLVTWTKANSKEQHPFPVIRCPTRLRILREHHWADVVYENNVCLRLSWPAILFRKPVVVALRTWLVRRDGKRSWQEHLKSRWLRSAIAVIAVSEAVRQRCWPAAIVIGNPYRSELFQYRQDIKRDRDFAFLGRLVSDKGADLALRALADLNSTRGDSNRLSLTIIGDGPQRPILSQLANELGIQDCVSFTGVLEGGELVETLNRHKILWVPSLWEEPFGNVALEGMACGCIPIVADGGGLPDAVGKAGLVFRRGELNDMIDCSNRLINDANLFQELRAEAAVHLENHRPEVVARLYLDVIEGALARQRK